MAELPYQWAPKNGVKHAWVYQATGLVTTCGRQAEAMPLPPLQGDELACGACVIAIEWYNKTGQPDYLTPRPHGSLEHDASEAQAKEEADAGEAEAPQDVN